MFSYYTSIIFLSLMTLAVLSVLIRDNDRLKQADKRLHYITYAIIGASAFAEWCGVWLDGRADLPRYVMVVVKCMDYILTPMAGGALALQMGLRNRWQNALLAILGGNALFQIISAFFGWTVVVDEANHYSHGPLYSLYMGVCLASIFVIIVQCIIYSRSFRRENRKSLYAIMLLVVVGISIQEVMPAGNRTAYVTLAFAVALMFIYYSEFSQLAMHDFMTEQQRLLDTDVLTGLLSRSAYSRALNELDAQGKLPKAFAAFTIDINGLKQVNDTLGHAYGDKAIIGIANTIKNHFRKDDVLIRAGGDEFIALTSNHWEASKGAPCLQKNNSDPVGPKF